MQVALRVLAVVIPIAIGMLLRGTGVLGAREGDVLRRVVVKLTVPLLVFFSLYDAELADMNAIPLMLAGIVLISIPRFMAGWLASRSVVEPERKAAVHASATLGNYGWLGFGVVHALLGDVGLRRAVFFTLGWWPVFFLFGLTAALMHEKGRADRPTARVVLKLILPVLTALAAGILLRAGDVALPAILEEAVRPFARMTVPLILLSVGLNMDLSRWHAALGPAFAVSFVSLVVAPLVAWPIAVLLTSDPVSRAVIVLEAGMPVATLTAVLADYSRIDVQTVNSAVLISTLASFVTLPIVAALVC